MKLANLIWIYPDRGSTTQRHDENNHVWHVYARLAATLGLSLQLVSPEDVSFDKSSSVFVEGRNVSIEDTVFITSYWSLPHQVVDMANQMYLYQVLERLGFYLPIHPSTSALTSDKYATLNYLADCGVQTVPSARIGVGRNTVSSFNPAVLDGLSFPMITKPAFWGMGIGVCRVNSLEELKGVIGLASGSCTPIICQPDLGQGTEDFRVYVIDGMPRLTLQRTPVGKSLIANLSSGGSMQFVDLPEALRHPLEHVHNLIALPYYAVDFLYNGAFWLSEVELDGAIAFPDSMESSKIQEEVILERFTAYVRGHQRWIEEQS